MISAIEYFQFCLKTSSMDYPESSLRELTQLIDNAVTQTMADANQKLQNKLSINSQEELIALVQLEPTIEAVLFYRLERLLFIHDADNPLLPHLASAMRRRTGMEIYYSTAIGQGFNVQHGFGIVIGPRFSIGKNFTIHQGVTLGQKRTNSPTDTITIGDNVTIYANATVLGNIAVGDNAVIGANSLVLKDVEANSVYAGSPAVRLR